MREIRIAIGWAQNIFSDQHCSTLIVLKNKTFVVQCELRYAVYRVFSVSVFIRQRIPFIFSKRLGERHRIPRGRRRRIDRVKVVENLTQCQPSVVARAKRTLFVSWRRRRDLSRPSVCMHTRNLLSCLWRHKLIAKSTCYLLHLSSWSPMLLWCLKK